MWMDCHHIIAAHQSTLSTETNVASFLLNVSGSPHEQVEFIRQCGFSVFSLDRYLNRGGVPGRHELVSSHRSQTEKSSSLSMVAAVEVRLRQLLKDDQLPLSPTKSSFAAYRKHCKLSMVGKMDSALLDGLFSPDDDAGGASITSTANEQFTNATLSSRVQVQRTLQTRELYHWKRAIEQVSLKNISLAGFYHVSRWAKYWREIVEEQLLIVDGRRQFGHRAESAAANQVLDWSREWVALLAASNLTVNVVGKDTKEMHMVEHISKKLNLTHVSKLRFTYNRTIPRGEYFYSNAAQQQLLNNAVELSEGEFSTVQRLRSHCEVAVRANQRTFVYYFHNKGGCCSRRNPKFKRVNPVASWREAMNAFTLEYPSICLRALLKGHPTCGFEYQDAHYRFDCHHMSVFSFYYSLTNSFQWQFLVG
jgi:hypothetical protein